MMNRILYLVGCFTLATASILMLSVFYLYFFDGNPPAILTVPYKTTQDVYHQGEPIVVEAHVCKTKRYPVTTYPYLVKIPEHLTTPPMEGKLFPLPPIASVGTPVGCGTFSISGFYTVPKDMAPGRYFLKATNVFQVNFLVTRSVDWYTNEFQVKL